MHSKAKSISIGKKFFFYISVTIILIVASVIYESRVDTNSSPEKIAANFQKDFSEANNLLGEYLKNIAGENNLNEYLSLDSLMRSLIIRGS